MSASSVGAQGEPDLERRLTLVNAVLDRSPDPLDAPFAVAYEPMAGDDYVAAWKDFARRAAAGAAHPAAVLYVHLPFCARVCSYCLLSASQTPGKGPVEAYLKALHGEVAMLEPAVRLLRFSSLHIGGGTPSLLSEAQLDELLGGLSRFARADGFQIGVEAHPATASKGKLEVLRRRGVDRVSFGVETFTPDVLREVNRGDQTAERVASAVRAARDAGLAVNLDLLAGLPGETEGSFAASVRMALTHEPDSMSVNRFLTENSPLGESGYSPAETDMRRADGMLLEADRIIREEAPPRWPAEPLTVPGFGTQYVWDRTSKARAYFQQDMIGPSSTLALGHGGMGHILGRFYSIAAGDFTDYVAAIERGTPPPMLSSPVSARFEMAFFVADRVCRDSLSPREFVAVFHEDPRVVLGRELSFLVARGLLRVDDGRIRKPANRAFQVTHLLAFLSLGSDDLERMLAALPKLSLTHHARRQYDAVAAELPPSLLWCRMAIRASRARALFRGKA
jgi:coproporphyrinogen III oxidase-like Fe-S oxidoreductase